MHPAAEAPAALPTTPAVVREQAGGEVMRAIVLEKFGGLDSLVYTEIPKPRPRDGQVVIEVKAFGLNHAELHMRKGEWAESPTSAASSASASSSPARRRVRGRRKGGGPDGRAGPDDQRQLRRVHPRARDERGGHRVGPLVGRLAAIPRPTPRPGRACSATWRLAAARRWSSGGRPRPSARRPQHGGQRRGEGHRHHPQSDRFPMLTKLGASALRGRGAGHLAYGSPRPRRSMRCSTWSATAPSSTPSTMLRRGGRACLAGWLGGLAPIPDFNPLLQMASGVYLTFFGSFVFGKPGFPLSDVPLSDIAEQVKNGQLDAGPALCLLIQ